MALEQSYTAQAAGSAGFSTPAQPDGTTYWPLTKLRKAYTDYLFNKREEIDEQIEARRYYHGSQWTQEQITALRKRKQPIMTFNRIARKIDGVTGLIERLRQDPKAFPRTPKHEQGAELATATIRYALDESDWKAKSPLAAIDGAVDGIGGIELELIDGDTGDKEVGFDLVDVQAFFYDPKSYKMDFSDARYMGIGKWLDTDTAKDMFPDADENAFTGDDELVNSSDRERRWFRSDGVTPQVRIVDCWYKHKGGWCWAIYSGNQILMEGKSYFQDEKKKDFCKYIMFSGNVDQDGDRYGFIRNMKSAQDGINAKQSKMQHILASRRLIMSHGAVEDIEQVRKEWARPDGIILTNRPVNEGVKADDQSFDFTGVGKLLELNLAEIENFGPNPALIGQGIENKSGRAIALLQQAGMAELGPYILAFKGWKIRIYRAIWNAIQKHWTGERWIRVTDSEDTAQFIQINGMQIDPMTGQPGLVNALGSLDVDIIMDEGDDHMTSMAETYEMLQQIIPSIAPTLSPQEARLYGQLIVDASGLPHSIKQQFKQASQEIAQQPPQPDPAVAAEQEKAALQLKTTEQMGQLKAQQQADDNIAKRQSHMIDLEFQEKKAAQELNILRTKNDEQLYGESEKARIQRDNDKAKAGDELNLARVKNKMAVDHESEKSRVRLEGETAKVKAKGDHKNLATGKKQEVDAVKEIAESFTKGMAEITGAMTQALNAPKTISVKRDGSGKVVGATAN
jgi:hypothetical protein